MKSMHQDSDQSPRGSFYAEDMRHKNCHSAASLQNDLKLDVAIIGAGYAGLTTACGLLQRGCEELAVFDADDVGAGASGRNGGFIMGGYSLPPAALIRQLGASTATRLYQLTVTAQQAIKSRIQDQAMDCDLVDEGIVLADRFRRPQQLRALQQVMNDQLGADWQWLQPEQLREWVRCEHYQSGLYEPQGAHFQPLAYAHALANQVSASGGRVYAGTRCVEVSRDTGAWRLRMQCGEAEYQVRSDRLVICCGGYIEGLNVPQAKGILPIATFMVATEPLGDLLEQILPGDAAVYDNRFAFDYYRKSRDQRLLWGGRISTRQQSRAWIAARLKTDMVRLYPELHQVRIEHAWGGLMAYTRNSMPEIRHHGDGHWSAIGFGGHGVATTALAGELLAAGICGEHKHYQQFDAYCARPVYGAAGMAAAQLYYWWQQMRDAVRL
jgi:gamma-glutamylputrescine oxidase